MNRFVAAIVVALLAPAAAAYAQDKKTSVFVGEPDGGKWQEIELVESAPLDAISHVTGAPFMADALTEFTQVLGDGNRIERRYSSSIARDSQGRTRREEDIVLVGPLAWTGPAPKLVTIVDPDANVSYTLDQKTRVAHRSQLAVAITGLNVNEKKMVEQLKLRQAPGGAPAAPGAFARKLEGGPAGDAARTESLGTRTFDGVAAQGTRTTSTIPAGAVGNLQPIEIVSERWFSPELQMPVLITRRDPRAGDTVYRLVNIARAEPPSDFFTIPPDYEIREGKLAVWKKLEAAKVIETRKKK